MSIKDCFSKCEQTYSSSADLFWFTKEVFNTKLHFLCSDKHLCWNRNPESMKSLFGQLLLSIIAIRQEPESLQRYMKYKEVYPELPKSSKMDNVFEKIVNG